jgi:hypothetical protein
LNLSIASASLANLKREIEIREQGTSRKRPWVIVKPFKSLNGSVNASYGAVGDAVSARFASATGRGFARAAIERLTVASLYFFVPSRVRFATATRHACVSAAIDLKARSLKTVFIH